MARTRAWRDFQASRPEVSDLLELARELPDKTQVGRRVALQESVLRFAAVTIVGALHRYLAALLEDWADKLVGEWDALSVLQRRFVALQVRRGFENVLQDLSEGDLWDEKHQRRFRTSTLKLAEWLQNPVILAASPDRAELNGFFRDQGAKAIDLALSRFRGDGQPFFEWLIQQRPEYGGYRDRLNDVITIRNEVAHGVVNRRLTIGDIRSYWATITWTIRKAEEFLA